jgi:hypothetical protein
MQVKVRVLEVNLEKKQLALTMKSEAPKKESPARARRDRGKPRADAKRQSARPGRPHKPKGRSGESRPRPSSSGHVPLNNPFAVLADLKKTLKPRR